MNKARALMTLVSVMAATLVVANGSWAQDALTAKLQNTGEIRVNNGDAELAMIELSAHGPGWQHAPQNTAAAEVSDLPNQAGKRFVGVLPIPNTDGGAINYTETVRTLPQGLQIEYDLTMAGAMKLNGLQVSVYLPVTEYGGKEALISAPQGEPEIANFPVEPQTNQIWGGEGSRVEVAKGADDAVTIELRAATDVLIQDLRQWDQPVFEIRFPAIMDDQGRAMSAADRFHLDFTITFAAPVQLEAPDAE